MKNMKLVFFEDFDDKLDENIWIPLEISKPANKENQYYLPRNYEVKDSKLILYARKEQYGGKQYTSCRIETRDRLKIKYGRVEIKAKIPFGLGTWPAIWMMGQNIGKVGWPQCGEIDIMEHVGYNPGFINYWIHTGTLNHRVNKQRGGRIYIKDLEKSFHVYALQWSNDYLDIYIDDIRVFTMQKKDYNGENEWPFDQEFYLIFNIAVGGTWGGSHGIDDSIFPQTMEIDYVKIYQLVNDEYHFDQDQERQYL